MCTKMIASVDATSETKMKNDQGREDFADSFVDEHIPANDQAPQGWASEGRGNYVEPISYLMLDIVKQLWQQEEKKEIQQD